MTEVLLVVSASAAILPDTPDATVATLEISLETGKIIAVHAGERTREDYPDLAYDNFIELQADHVLLPGLVDCVSFAMVDIPFTN